jgi:hypothetical protein
MTAVLETNRGDILSGMSEALRDMIKECRMVFCVDEVRLYGKDCANVVTVQCSLPANLLTTDDQGTYCCSDTRIEVGIDTKFMAKCLSSVSCGDLVSFSVNTEEDPDHLGIKCQNPAIGKRCSWSIVTPLPEDEPDPIAENPISNYAYNSELTLSSALFHDMIRDLTKSDATSIRVCCDGNRLVLAANGRHIKSSSELLRGTEARHFSCTKSSTDRWPVCECFSMTLMQKVAKAKGVSQSISIFLYPNFPIAFSYKTSIGTLSYIIVSKEDAEWTESPLSRVMPIACEDIKGVLPRTRINVCKKKDDGTPQKLMVKKDEEDDEVKVEESSQSSSQSEEEPSPPKKKRPKKDDQ